MAAKNAKASWSGVVNMRCVVCDKLVKRTWNEDRGGFGSCPCGGELVRRTMSLQESAKYAKAKQELALVGP